MDRKDALDLLDKTADELKSMSKMDVHEGYKKIMTHMLIDFYIDCTKSDFEPENMADLLIFCKEWVGKRIKPPNREWNPGDEGGM